MHHIFAMLDITMTIFIIMIVVVAILIVYSFAIRLQREKVLRRFVTSLHVIDRELVLPETIPIELGYVSVKCLWKSSGRSRYYSCKFNVSGKEVKEVSKVDVNSICNNPFYIYVNQSNEVLALAPGFRVSAGKYKGIYVLCLDSSKIPSTAIELIAHSNSEKAVGRVEVSTEGYEALVHWAFEAPREKKVVFDDKAGLYRVVEEYRGKPKARSARIELCFLTVSQQMVIHCLHLLDSSSSPSASQRPPRAPSPQKLTTSCLVAHHPTGLGNPGSLTRLVNYRSL